MVLLIMNHGNTLTDVDAQIIEDVLSQFKERVKLLEVGFHTGETSRNIKQWCDDHCLTLEYWGIDNGAQSDCQPPFPDANTIKGDSAEVFHQIPFDLDVAFIDGCHCGNHVILDTIHYGARVKWGGFMIFHDTSPELQQTMRDPHGPATPWFHNSVVAAHELMKFPTAEWSLWKSGYQAGRKIGGVTVYQKNA